MAQQYDIQIVRFQGSLQKHLSQLRLSSTPKSPADGVVLEQATEADAPVDSRF